jgi:hypothetical protein
VWALPTRSASGRWSRAAIGGTCAYCGVGTISPVAYDGSTLYVGGGSPEAGSTYKGVVYAFNPNLLGSPLWTHATSDTVMAAVTAAPGIIVVGEGKYVLVIDTHNGRTVASLSKGTGIFYGAPSISHGVLCEGDTNGYLYAYSVNSA